VLQTSAAATIKLIDSSFFFMKYKFNGLFCDI